MSENRNIVKNTFFLFLTNFLSMFSGFIITILIARNSLPIDYGNFTFAQSYANLLLIVADFGLSTLIVVDIARNKDKLNEYLPHVYGFKLFLSILFLVSNCVIINFMHYDKNVVYLVYLTGAAYMFNSLFAFYCNVFRGLEMMQYETYLNILLQSLLIILCLVALYVFKNIMYVAIAYLLARLAAVIASIIIFKRKNITSAFTIELDKWNRLFRRAMPFGFHQLFSFIYFQIDALLISQFKGNESVGYYQSATRLIIALMIVTDTIMGVMMPVMSRYHDSKDKLKSMYDKCLKLMWVVSVFFAAETFLNSKQIIRILYKTKYDSAIPILMILSFVVVLRFVGNVPAILLTSVDKQKVRFYIVVIGSIINVSFNLLLIPRYDYIGAAYASLITNFILCVIHFYVVYKMGYKSVGINILKLIMFAAVIVVSDLAIKNYILSNIFIKGMLVLVIACIACLALKIFSREELANTYNEVKRK